MRKTMLTVLFLGLCAWADPDETDSPEYKACVDECRASDHLGCEGVCREDESPSCAVGAAGPGARRRARN